MFGNLGSEVARIFVTVGANTAEFVKGLASSEQKMAAFGRRMTDLGRKMTVGLTLPIAAFATKAVMAFNESERAAAKMAAVIDSTGASSWTTSAAMQALAASIQKTTVFEDDLVVSAEAVLLTFKHVTNAVGEGNDIFDRAMRAATDLSTVLGSDLEGATLQLGKALEDPVRGMMALRRSGVSFSQEQVNLVKSLVESNNTLEAQKLILAEVESQFGGAAEAVAKTAGGQWQQALVRLGNAMEQLGGIIAPFVAAIADTLANAFEWFSRLPGPVKNFVVIMGGLIAIAGPVVLAIGAITTAFVQMSAAQLAAMGYMVALGAAIWAATSGATALAEALEGPTEILGTELIPELADVAQYGEDAASQIEGLANVIKSKATGNLKPFTIALEQMEQAFKTGAVSGEVAAGVIGELMPENLRRLGYSAENYLGVWRDEMADTADGVRILKYDLKDFAGMTGMALADWRDKAAGSFDAVGDALATLKDKTKVTFSDIMGALRDQLDAWRNWTRNLSTLIKKGVSEDLVLDLFERGPEEMASQVATVLQQSKDDILDWANTLEQVSRTPQKAADAIITVATQFKTASEQIKRYLRSILTTAADYATGVTLVFRGQKEMGAGATGAIVRNPTLALIGEAGPEAVIPLNQMPGASPLPTSTGGGGNLSVNVVIDRKTFVRQQEYLGRASGL